MTSTSFHYPRDSLATEIADRLTGRAVFGAEPTLCLAAPRRTGKSTFLRFDLAPVLRERGLEVVYVDLWGNRSTDPSSLISDAIRANLSDLDNPAVKVAKAVGLKKVAGTEFDLNRIGQPNGPTLADALALLRSRSGRKLVLMVDEAQHALTTPAGENAMYALKAARDQLNTVGDPGDAPNLGLVLTGSHRDKLVRLVNGRKAPFLGTSVTNFPLLNRSFSDALTDWLNKRLAEDRKFEHDAVWQAFSALGCEPERIIAAMRDVVVSPVDDASPSKLLLERAEVDRETLRSEQNGLVNSLSPIQRAVLRRMALSPDSGPFSQAAMTDYSQYLGEPVETPAVQSALEALRQKDIVWKSARGDYAIEDGSFGDPAIWNIADSEEETDYRP